MREINIDESFRARANAVASEEAKMIGSLDGSIEKGGGNYAGVFGELPLTLRNLEVIERIHTTTTSCTRD